MYFHKKAKIPAGRGVFDYGILRAWRVTHSGIYEGKGGLKHGRRLDMDTFWNYPILHLISLNFISLCGSKFCTKLLNVRPWSNSM